MSKETQKKKSEIQVDVLKTFHNQFALNQNHHQALFIQFISAVFIVVIGYGIIYSNTVSTANLFDAIRNDQGEIISYSAIHLLGTYFVSQIVLILLGSLILNIGYSFRRDQKVNYEIRKRFLNKKLYQEVFGERSFNPSNKGLIFNSFLPGFNLIFVSFIYFLQLVLLTSIFIASCYIEIFHCTFYSNVVKSIITIVLLIAPILLSARYLQHYYHKYKKTVN